MYSVALILFGLTSLPYLQDADPTITLWSNIWPRVLLNSVPMALAAWVIYKSKICDAAKIRLAFLTHGIVFLAAAMIYTWPLCFSVNPKYLLFVNGSNISYFVAFWIVVAPPRKEMISLSLIFLGLIVSPLLAVAYILGDKIIFNTIAGDTLMFSASAVFCSFFFSNLYKKIELLKMEQQSHAAKFLGKSLSSAIFDGKQDILKEEIRNGYIMVVDIRDSTKLTNQYKQQWPEFIREWFDVASKTISKHNGHLLKTVGDCLVISFGIFEEQTDLSDIPGIESELHSANMRRWTQLTKDCFECVDELMAISMATADKIIPDAAVRFGAGVDRGPVVRGVRGGADKFELDIWGDRINCAAKLEAYSKNAGKHFQEKSSALVISPFASDFIEAQTKFIRLETAKEPLNGFPGIRYVLAKEYARNETPAVATTVVETARNTDKKQAA